MARPPVRTLEQEIETLQKNNARNVARAVLQARPQKGTDELD